MEEKQTSIKTFGLCGRYDKRLNLGRFFRFRKGFIPLNVGQGIKRDLKRKGLLS